MVRPLCAAFDDRQLLDIVFTVGVYTIMSTILNTARVPLEPGFPPVGDL